MGIFADGLILPAIVLALCGWLVPRGLSLVWAEGVRPLILLALASAGIMLVLGAGMFLCLYLWRGVPLSALAEAGAGAAFWHFGRLALISALFWGPIMILSVARLPQFWVKEEW